MDIGPGELMVVLAIVLLIFGGSKLPQLARSIGEAQREFRRAASGAADPEPVAPGIEPTAPTSETDSTRR